MFVYSKEIDKQIYIDVLHLKPAVIFMCCRPFRVTLIVGAADTRREAPGKVVRGRDKGAPLEVIAPTNISGPDIWSNLFNNLSTIYCTLYTFW
jgi:hypothetical protein